MSTDRDEETAREVLDHIPAGCVLPSCDTVLTQAIAAALRATRAEGREEERARSAKIADAVGTERPDLQE